MDVGLEIFNDAGIEQISSNGVNFALVHKEVINSMSAWTAISGPRAAGLTYSFAVAATSPVVAVATSATGQSGAVFAFVTSTGTNQWSVQLYGGASETSVSSPGVVTLNATVVVYVFDVAPAPTSGPGLAVYNASGVCVFNAAYPGMRVVQMLDDNNNMHGYGTSLTPPSGKTYAVSQRASWGQLIIGSVNATTGDRIANMYRFGVSGGYAGATVQFGYGYPCFINGAFSLPHGASGAVGNIYATSGCNDGGSPRTYFSDGIVIDVTNL